ncbi:MAG: DUF5715 family protein [Niabella sp.]
MMLFFFIGQSTNATVVPIIKKSKTDSLKPTYKSHLKTATGHGITPIKNSKQLTSYVNKKKLATTKCVKGCTINKLTYSKAYMVPKANKVLNEIAKAFYAKTKSSFTVTSITRTLADQHRLRQVNNNATHGLSSHNYGCSYDISYIRFNGKKAPNARLQKALENILIQYQKKGKIYYIKEKWQSCFHITVRS